MDGDPWTKTLRLTSGSRSGLKLFGKGGDSPVGDFSIEFSELCPLFLVLLRGEVHLRSFDKVEVDEPPVRGAAADAGFDRLVDFV